MNESRNAKVAFKRKNGIYEVIKRRFAVLSNETEKKKDRTLRPTARRPIAAAPSRAADFELPVLSRYTFARLSMKNEIPIAYKPSGLLAASLSAHDKLHGLSQKPRP